MADDDPSVRACRHVPADALTDADPTPGMTRRVGLDDAAMWSGTVDTEPGTASGWHHHGEHETTLYVLNGRMPLEFGTDGGQFVEAGAGDFLHVPAHAVHRELNPGQETSRAVIVRCGTGAATVNVDGPAR